MTRVAVVVEGQTEKEFIKRIVAPYLRKMSSRVWIEPVLLHKARYRQGGGNVTVGAIVRDLKLLLHSYDAVTTLVDFYGFKNKDNNTADQLAELVRERVKQWKPDLGRYPVLPYIQRHEFEGLLFSFVGAFKCLDQVNSGTIDKLREIRSQFQTPEDINDNWNTAPSRRISELIPRYNKPVDGPQIAERVGLTRMRQECPGFNAWINVLEALPDRLVQS